MCLEQRMVNAWNRNYRPGQSVMVDGFESLRTRTLCRAEMSNGVAMIFLDETRGPVPLSKIRPAPRDEWSF